MISTNHLYWWKKYRLTIKVFAYIFCHLSLSLWKIIKLQIFLSLFTISYRHVKSGKKFDQPHIHIPTWSWTRKQMLSAFLADGHCEQVSFLWYNWCQIFKKLCFLFVIHCLNQSPSAVLKGCPLFLITRRL